MWLQRLTSFPLTAIEKEQLRARRPCCPRAVSRVCFPCGPPGSDLPARTEPPPEDPKLYCVICYFVSRTPGQSVQGNTAGSVRDKDVLLLTGNPAHPSRLHIMACEGRKRDSHQHFPTTDRPPVGKARCVSANVGPHTRMCVCVCYAE